VAQATIQDDPNPRVRAYLAHICPDVTIKFELAREVVGRVMVPGPDVRCAARVLSRFPGPFDGGPYGTGRSEGTGDGSGSRQAPGRTAVNHWGGEGRWEFLVCRDPQLLGVELAQLAGSVA
jgi:hypothetical protein